MNVLEGKFQKGGGSDSGTILGLLLIYIYVVRCERGWVKSCLHMPGQQRTLWTPQQANFTRQFRVTSG